MTTVESIQVDTDREIQVGIVGTGFIARGLYAAIQNSPAFGVGAVLTRRHPQECSGFEEEVVTNSEDELFSEADVIVECSGDVLHATSIVRKALEEGLPVATMDAELQVTTGSYLKGMGGYLTEAEGDQPGSLAALHQEAVAMGFQPRVYGNVKGFLSLDPSAKEMEKWSRIQGISVPQVTSFTDGTKVQVEQVLVANGLGADLAPGGMIGGQTQYDGFQQGALALGAYAREQGIRLSDFLMCVPEPSPGREKAPPGVFIVAEHQDDQADYLRYYKMGEGPQYVLQRPFHLCHLEVLKTLRDIVKGEPPLLTNGEVPRYSVAAIAKRDIRPGEVIERGIGGFQTRGEGISIVEDMDHVPIGLLQNTPVIRHIKAGEVIHFDNVDLPESEAMEAWRQTVASQEKRANYPIS